MLNIKNTVMLVIPDYFENKVIIVYGKVLQNY